MAWARRRGSGRYQGCYRDQWGRPQTVGTFIRKNDAVRAAEDQEALIRGRRWVDPALSRTPFSDWAEHRMKTTLKHQRASTRARDDSYLRSLLLPTFGPMPLGAIEPVQVQSWVARLAEGHAPATVSKAYQFLARLMAAAEDSGYIARTPCRGVRLPRHERTEMRFLSATELERLAESVPDRHRALVLTGGYIGLRWGELAGLKRQRLNLLHSSLEVAETIVEVRGRLSFGEPKTAASRRTLALPPFLVEELRTHLDRFATHGELVFAGRDGGPLRRTNFRSRVWLPAVQSAGLPPLRFHDLRHTAAALMIAQGAHPKLIQSRLGHSSIQVTFDVYGHLLPALDEELAKGLEATRTAALSEKPAAHMLPVSEPRT